MCVGPELALAAEAAPELLGMTGAAALSPFAAAAPEAFAAEAAPALAGLAGAAGSGSELLSSLGPAALGSSDISSLFGASLGADAGGSMLLSGSPSLLASGDAASPFGTSLGKNAAPQSLFNAKNAMLLGRMAGMASGQQPAQLGGPADYSNPNLRSAQMTQQQITKKWLLKNDPNTYRRIYGEPQQGT